MTEEPTREEDCKTCKEDFGHPDNCIGCPDAPAEGHLETIRPDKATEGLMTPKGKDPFIGGPLSDSPAEEPEAAEDLDLSILATWERKPYERDNLAGHIYPISSIGTGTFDDGAKFHIAWFPKTEETGDVVLVVDVPDRRVVYHLSIPALLRILEAVE